jgi:hypothetical protein
MTEVWRRHVFPIATFVVLSVVGQWLMPTELYKLLWIACSPVISVVMWHYINRYISRRRSRSREGGDGVRA